MTRLALLSLLVLAGAAHEAAAACERSRTWDAFVRCNLRTQRFELVRDLTEAKLVAFDLGHDPHAKRLELYVRVDGVWMRNGFYGETNLHNELLGFEALADDAYRIELGYAAPQWVTFDQVSMRPALLRRTFVHVCKGTTGCRQVMTSCQLLVHGKVVAGYRGEPIWDGTTLKLRADLRAENRYCSAPRNLVVDS